MSIFAKYEDEFKAFCGSQKHYSASHILKVNFLNCLEDAEPKATNIQLFYHFLCERDENAVFYLQKMRSESSEMKKHVELFDELGRMHNMLLHFYDNLTQAVRIIKSNQQELEVMLQGLEKLEAALSLKRSFARESKRLFDKWRIKSSSLNSNHCAVDRIVEEILQIATHVITSHIELSNEERSLFSRLESYRAIFSAFAQEVDKRNIYPANYEEESQASKVLEYVS